MFGCYHTHSEFCDGKMELEDYVKKAIEVGFKAIGFSGHAPIGIDQSWLMKESSLDNYINETLRLKEFYKDKIEIYLGLEIDYINGLIGPKSEKFNRLNLDYNIGSVHFFKKTDEGEYLTVDGPIEEYEKLLNNVYQGDVRKFVGGYYENLREMVIIHKPDIIGHIDIIKKNNRENKFFNENENWYKEEIIKTLDLIAKTSSIVEVNTGGRARGFMKEFYPSNFILKECLNRGIKIMLNADAHHPNNINAYYKEAIETLKDIGFKTQSVLYHGTFQEMTL